MNFWLDKRVFITGASGFLGGWLTEALIAMGAEVVVLLRDRPRGSRLFEQSMYSQLHAVSGDLSDSDGLERILAEYEIECVFHLAAQAIVPIANRNPLSTWESNVGGTWRLLESIRRVQSVQAILVASSDKAYGEQEGDYYEDMPLNATFPYDVSKACADMIAMSYAKSFDLPIAITRCGNLFGGGDLNWSRLIPGTLRSLCRGRAPVIRSNGHPTRDYLYVQDAVSAYLNLAQRLWAYPAEFSAQAFNFSGQIPLRVDEVVHLLMSKFDAVHLPIKHSIYHGEIEHQVLNLKKSQQQLHWSPSTNFEEAIESTIQWYQAFFSEEGHANLSRLQSLSAVADH